MSVTHFPKDISLTAVNISVSLDLSIHSDSFH